MRFISILDYCLFFFCLLHPSDRQTFSQNQFAWMVMWYMIELELVTQAATNIRKKSLHILIYLQLLMHFEEKKKNFVLWGDQLHFRH